MAGEEDEVIAMPQRLRENRPQCAISNLNSAAPKPTSPAMSLENAWFWEARMSKVGLLIAAGLAVLSAGCVQDSGYPNTAYGYGPNGYGYNYGGYSSPPPGYGGFNQSSYQPGYYGPSNGYYAQRGYYGPPPGYYAPPPPPRRWF
jgi:hypothetical protein